MPPKKTKEQRDQEAAESEFKAAQRRQARAQLELTATVDKSKQEADILQAEAEAELLQLAAKRKRERLQLQSKARIDKEEAERMAAEAEIEIQAHQAKLMRERLQSEAKAKKAREEAEAAQAEAEFELIAAQAKARRLRAENEAKAKRNKEDQDALAAEAEAEILAYAAKIKYERRLAEEAALDKYNKENGIVVIKWDGNGMCLKHPDQQLATYRGCGPCKVWTDLEVRCPECDREGRTSAERKTVAIYDQKGNKVGTKLGFTSQLSKSFEMKPDAAPTGSDCLACVCFGKYTGVTSMLCCSKDDEGECLALYCCGTNILPCCAHPSAGGAPATAEMARE
jgi:hypothetical protein